MKAIIFAAGLGTRLRPLTDNKPKALVEVDGRPMLEHVVRRLINADFNEIVVNVHHYGQQIIDFLKSNDNFGAEIHVSDERDLLLDTGGGIRKARKWLDGDKPFLIHNADILTDLDLKAFYDNHLHHNADISLLAAERTTSRYLLCDEENRLHGWTNIKTGQVRPEGFLYDKRKYHPLAYGCIQAVSPKIFERLEKFTNAPKFSIFDFYLGVCEEFNIRCACPKDYNWFDIGTPEKLLEADTWFKQNKIKYDHYRR